MSDPADEFARYLSDQLRGGVCHCSSNRNPMSDPADEFARYLSDQLRGGVCHCSSNRNPMSDAAPEPPLAYSPGDAARMLGCSRDTIYTLMHRGELQSYKVGGMRRIKRSDLLALLGE